MNLFNGMTDRQIISVALDFILFNGFVALEAMALAAFYVSSKPRRGRVRTASLWHMVAALWFLMSVISTVWAAPAEKSFINADDPSEALFSGERFQKVVIGLIFALLGILCIVAGAIHGARQRRRWAEQTLLEA